MVFNRTRAEDGLCPRGSFSFLFLLSFTLGGRQSRAETLGGDMQWLPVSFCRAHKHPKSDSVGSSQDCVTRTGNVLWPPFCMCVCVCVHMPCTLTCMCANVHTQVRPLRHLFCFHCHHRVIRVLNTVQEDLEMEWVWVLEDRRVCLSAQSWRSAAENL